MPETTPEPMNRRRLGERLQAGREAAGLSRQHVADTIGTSVATLARVENGRQWPKPALFRDVLDLLELDAVQRAVCEGLFTSPRGPELVGGSQIRRTYGQFIRLEAAATTRRDYAAIVMPSPLQTAAYASAVISAAVPPLSDDAKKARLKTRLERQRLLAAEDRAPLEVHAMLDEGCVRREIGGRPVWLDQLAHLLALAHDYPNVALQIVPFSKGAHASTLGGFVILHFNPADRPMAFIELPGGDIYAEGDDADPYGQRFDMLQRAALSPQDSLRIIEQIRKDAA